jgi:ketosteroid isomerase-like protein
MSQENVEILRRLHEALNRGDLDNAVQYLHPEVELRPGIVAPDQSSLYRGRDGVQQFFETVYEAFEEQRTDIGEIIEVGDRVLAVEDWRVRGRDGIELQFEVIDLYTFRDGLIVRADGFVDRSEALEAAGLRE